MTRLARFLHCALRGHTPPARVWSRWVACQRCHLVYAPDWERVNVDEIYRTAKKAPSR